MRRSCPQAIASLTVGVSLLLGCQSALGIHGGTLADASMSTGGTLGRSLAPSENTGGRPTAASGGGGAAGSVEAPGGSAASSGGSAGSAASSGGTGGSTAADTGGAGGLGGDPRGETGGTSAPDAGSGEVGGEAPPATDAGVCASPWRASAVPAYLLAINSGGTTACGFAGKDLPARAAGVDTDNFRGAAACGVCLRVRAVNGGASVVVPVVERSGSGGVLLSRAAMDQVAAGSDVATVDWVVVPCDVGVTPVRYRINSGSNASYLAVQVRNARYPLASLSLVTTAGLVPLTLQSYGSWETRAAGSGPVTFRLTDINGQSFDDPNVRLAPGSEYVGDAQFPVCH